MIFVRNRLLQNTMIMFSSIVRTKIYRLRRKKNKSTNGSCKNNNREVFVLDYVSWMKYEAQGNVRLNKVARKIFVGWIPFSQEVRQKLSDNPMFKEIFHKFEILRNRRFDKEYQLYNRYKNEGGEITL